MLVNLGLVIAMIAALGWFVTRGQRLTQREDGALDIVACRMLGQRERLVVVQVGDEQVLLGVTATQISHLHTLAEPVTAAEAQTGFARKLGDWQKQLARPEATD